KSIPDAHANEIKKLRGVAGDIFDLPSKYFTNTNFERATTPEIQQLLGVSSATNQTYKTFPPVLFPGLKEDGSLKTVFGNWELLARVLKASLHGVTSLHHRSSGGGGAHTNALKWSVHQITPGAIAWAAVIAIFLLSPDTEFSSSGLGKKSSINYKTLFYNYKKVLVLKWTTKHVVSIVANINRYIFEAARGPAVDLAKQDHTDAINCALVALDMDSDSDDESDASALISAALSVADPEPSITSVTQSLSTIDARSIINSQPEAPESDIVRDALVADVDAQVVEANTQDAGDSVSGRGRAKTRGSMKKAAAPQAAAVSRTTRSRK
ncbi:hypothetical protein DFJ58DRAFT_665430, partial [Suillus subalutaceus]|uniref:uncharacterized protein n=1 Tax=Suillus subalutaceus TaxID=48586 RepID=UPI001B8711A5